MLIRLLLLILLPLTALAEKEDLPKIRYSIANIPWFLQYQEGYYLGTIAEGGTTGFPVKSYEGEILLGKNSSEAFTTDPRCLAKLRKKIDKEKSEDNKNKLILESKRKCRSRFNPVNVSQFWYNEDFLHNVGQAGLSLVRYRKYFAKNVFTDTNTYALKAYPAHSDNLHAMDSLDITDEFLITKYVHYASEHFEGLVVQAYVDGLFRPTYSIVVQEGGVGNIFHTLNVTTRQMFDFIVDGMSTGKQMRIHYYTLFTPEQFLLSIFPGYKTYYRVNKVEILD